MRSDALPAPQSEPTRQLVLLALRNPAIARLVGVWAVAAVSKWAFTIIIALFAYAEAGAVGVGMAALVRALPSAFTAPCVGLLVDRHSRVAALRISCAARAAFALAIACAVGAGAALVVVLGLAVGLSVADTAHKPAQAGLLPAFARTPSELAAANVLWSGLDNAGFLAGSVMVGALVGAAGVAVGFTACAIGFGLALLLALTLPAPPGTAPGGGENVRAGLFEGVRTVRRTPALRVLIGIYSADMLVQGLLDVLLVIAAIELLGLGEQGAAWLSGAWGVGGVTAGAVAAVALRHGRLALGSLCGCVVAGVSLMLIGIWSDPVAAVGLLVVFGIGAGMIEISHLTLTQRLVPADVLSRVYGVQEVIEVGTAALGGIAAAGLVALLGVGWALAVAGAVLPLTALVVGRSVAALRSGVSVSEASFALLRRLPIFAPLPIAAAERLTLGARTDRWDADADVIVQGEHADAFYVIADGTVEVVEDGISRGTVGPGGSFGEIGLLRDVPHTATARTRTPTTVLIIGRDEFLTAIAAHPISRRAAESAADLRRVRDVATGRA